MDLGHIETVIAVSGLMALLSVLVTAIVQAALLLPNVRGLILQWGISKLLHQVTGKKVEAAKAAREVVEHHSVSIGMGPWRRTTALRPEELGRILNELQQSSETGVSQLIGDNVKEKGKGVQAER